MANNPAIPYSDLFDFDGYEKAIREAQQQTLEFAQSIAKVSGNIKGQLASTLDEISKKKIEIVSTDDLEGLKKIDKELENTSASVKDYRDSLTGLKKANDAASDSITAQAENAKRLKKEYENLSAEQRQNTEVTEKYAKEIATAKQESKKFSDEINKATKQLNTSQGSYREMSNKLADLKKQLKDLPDAFDASTGELNKSNKQAVEYSKQISELDKSLKAMDASMGEFGRNVGNYEGGFSGLVDKFAELPGAAGAAGDGVKGLQGQFAKLMANPIVLLIGLIVAGLAALFNMFKRTQAGAEFFQKAGAALEGVMSALVGVVDTLAKGLQAAFENPKKAMQDFWEFLKNNVVNRFTALKDLVVSTGAAIKSLATGDFAALKQAAKDAATAVIQFNTGLDAQQQKSFIDKLGQLAQKAEEAAKAFYELEQAKIAYKKATREAEKEVENLTTIEELNKAIADDATKSFKERESAAERSRQTLEKRAKIEVDLAKQNLDLVNRELALRQKNGENVTELLDKQLEAYKSYVGAEREYTLAVRDNDKQRAELKQDRLEKDLDILIDGFDNQKTVNEKLLTDTRLTLKAREDLLEHTRQLGEDSFKRQIDTIQQFTNANIDANDLLKTSDATLLNQKIRSLGLSEIIEGRLLEVIKEKKIATQDFYDAEKALFEERQAREKAGEVSRMELQIEDLKTNGQAYLGLQMQLLEYERANELNTLGMTEQERLNIIEKYRQKEKQIKRDAIQEDADMLNQDVEGLKQKYIYESKSLDKSKAARKEAADYANNLTTQQIQNNLDALNTQYDMDLISYKDYTDKRAALDGQLQDLRLQKEQETQSKIQAIQTQTFSTIGAISSSYYAIQSQQIDANIEDINAQKDADIAAAGDNTKAKERIEKAYNKKVLAEKRKQAQLQKDEAAFNIVLSTAQAIMAVWKEWAGNPVIAGVLTAMVAASSIAQLAAVESKPLPKYAKGTDNAPGGLAIVNDAPGLTYKELIVSNGKVFAPQKRNQIVNLNRGDKVIRADLAQQALSNVELNKMSAASLTNERIAISLNTGRQAEIQANYLASYNAARVNEQAIGHEVGKQISQIPFQINTFDERGYTRAVRKGNTTTKYLNDRFSLK